MDLWRFVALLAVMHTVVAIAMTIVPNPEGVGGVLGYAAMYVGPAVLVAAAVSSREPGRQLAAGWASLVLAVFYLVVVVANWSGYSAQQQAFAIGVNTPSVALYLAVFWGTVLARREGRHSAR